MANRRRMVKPGRVQAVISAWRNFYLDSGSLNKLTATSLITVSLSISSVAGFSINAFIPAEVH